MIDIGPRLDSRLRGKFDRIEAEAPPERPWASSHAPPGVATGC